MDLRKVRSTFGVALAGLALAIPGVAFAQTSVEGTAIGDQGFYWNTPAEVWIFPHRLGNNDNEVMLQYGAPSTDNELYNLYGLPTYGGSTAASASVQTGKAGGINVEVADHFNVGLWFSEYAAESGAFLGRAIAATGWAGALPGGSDPYSATLESSRKLDLFVSYWLPDAGLETGLRFWWGSAHNHFQRDDSTGYVLIDDDNDPTTDPTEGDVTQAKYGLRDWGLALSGGFSGVQGFRADASVDVSMLGVTWDPSGLDQSYVNAGGMGYGVNLRAHMDMSDKVTVGGFLRYASQSVSMEPLYQRDGGDMYPLFTPDDPGTLPDPSAAAPTDGDPTDATDTGETRSGIKYTETGRHFQATGLVQYRPTSKVKIYGALGTRREGFKSKTSIGSDWSYESGTRAWTLPFVNVGFEGQVTNHLSMLMGATKQWRGVTTETSAVDNRIEDNDSDGPAGVDPAPGSNHTNSTRRQIDTMTSHDDASTSTTSLMLGTRITYGPVQLVGHFDPAYLLRGPYFLSGAGGNMWFWVAMIYDWDYDQDTETGNGTVKYAPHEAEKAVPASAPAPAVHLPPKDTGAAPAAGGQEFDS